MQSAEFTVLASWPAAVGLEAREIELVLNAGNGWSVPAGLQLPTGTVVTLSEAVPSGTGPSVEWGDATWSGEGLTVNEDGTASFVIGDNTAPTFTVTNEVTELTGRFSITKLVTGPVAGKVPEDFVFTVTYSYPGLEVPGTLTIHDGETVTSPTIPTGTVVTISEIAPTGTLPGGGGWGTPTFVLADGTTSTDTTTVTIGDADIVAVQLDNPTLPPLPVTGSNAQSMPAVLIGILLLLIGGAVYVISRRRRQTEMG